MRKPKHPQPPFVENAIAQLPIIMKQLYREINRSYASTVLISTESFFHLKNKNKQMIQSFLNYFSEVKVIVFLRRWDEYVESSCKQRIKECRGSKDFENLLTSQRGQVADVRCHLNDWADLVGKSNMIIKIHSNDVLPDFLSSVGIQLGKEFILPPRSNESLPPALVELKLRMNKAFKMCEDYADKETSLFEHTLAPYFRSISADKSKYPLLSPQQRIDILKENEAMSQAIAREFLGRKDGILFDEPWPDPNEKWQPYAGISNDELANIVAAMVLDYAQFKHRHQRFMRYFKPIIKILKPMRKLKSICSDGVKSTIRRKQPN